VLERRQVTPMTELKWLGLSRRASIVAALAFVYLVWGSTYFVLAVGVREVPPFLFAGARFLLAAALMAVVALVRREAWPDARAWLRGAAVGGLLFVVGNGGVTWAEQEVSSGLTAVIVASMPIWLALFAAAAGERPSRREAVGLVLGMAGVMVLQLGRALGGSSTAAAVLFVSPIGWALGSYWARRWTLASGAVGMVTQMLPAALVLLGLSALSAERVPRTVSPEVTLAMIYLVVFGSLIGISAYTFLLRATRPALATSYAYVNPMIAVLIGVGLGGETIGAVALLAGALVLTGVALATWRR